MDFCFSRLESFIQIRFEIMKIILRARVFSLKRREREKDLGWFFRCARWLLVKAMNGCVEYIFACARERERTLSLSLTRARKLSTAIVLSRMRFRLLLFLRSSLFVKHVG